MAEPKTQTEKDTKKAQGRTARSKEFQDRVDAASRVEQVGTPQGNADFTSTRVTAGGGGLPEYPPVGPPATNDALLVWDDTEGEANWSDEASLEDAGNEDVSLLVFGSEGLAKLDGYSATEGILVQNGLPVDVKILINFT